MSWCLIIKNQEKTGNIPWEMGVCIPDWWGVGNFWEYALEIAVWQWIPASHGIPFIGNSQLQGSGSAPWNSGFVLLGILAPALKERGAIPWEVREEGRDLFPVEWEFGGNGLG